MSLKFYVLEKKKKEGKEQMTLYLYWIVKPEDYPQSNKGQTEILTIFTLHAGCIC